MKKYAASLILRKFPGSFAVRLIPLLCLVLSFPMAVQGAEAIGKITKVTGTAYIERKTVVKPLMISLGMAVELGDQLKTRASSRVRVELKDGSVLSLGENAEIILEQFQLDEKKQERNALFNMAIGKLRVFTKEIAKLKKTNFRIKTPTALVGVRGTLFLVWVESSTITKVVCVYGAVNAANLMNLSQYVVLTASLAADIVKGEALGKPILMTGKQLEELQRDIDGKTGPSGTTKTTRETKEQRWVSDTITTTSTTTTTTTTTTTSTTTTTTSSTTSTKPSTTTTPTTTTTTTSTTLPPTTTTTSSVPPTTSTVAPTTTTSTVPPTTTTSSVASTTSSIRPTTTTTTTTSVLPGPPGPPPPAALPGSDMLKSTQERMLLQQKQWQEGLQKELMEQMKEQQLEQQKIQADTLREQLKKQLQENLRQYRIQRELQEKLQRELLRENLKKHLEK